MSAPIVLDEEVVVRDARQVDSGCPREVMGGPWHVVGITGVAAQIIAFPDDDWWVVTTTPLSNLRRPAVSR